MCVLPACAPCGCWELNPHLQEQQVHLASEPSLQPTFFFLLLFLLFLFLGQKISDCPRPDNRDQADFKRNYLPLLPVLRLKMCACSQLPIAMKRNACL